MPPSVLQSSIVPLNLSESSASRAGGAPPGREPLPFAMQHQLQREWCWAAVAASVSRFYDVGSPWTQCRLANEELGQTTCCADGSTRDCNKPWLLENALGRTRNMNGFPVAGSATMGSIATEIDGRRPVGVRIGWVNAAGQEVGGHFVVIDGYADLDLLDIQDPWYGPSTVSLEGLLFHYKGNGRWTHTYYTRKP